MAGETEFLKRCRAHNRLLADFAKHALSECALETLLQEAAELVAKGTGIRRAKVLRYQPETDELLVVAGVGWRPGVVGATTLPATMDSPPGRAFRIGAAVCISDLPNSREYRYSALLREHNIVSLLNVPIAFERETWGVLEVDSETESGTVMEDEPFLIGFANVLASAIRQRRLAAEREAISLEREVLLRKRDVLFRELHHRVHNNFHAISGLLEIELHRAPAEARESLDKLAQRMAAIIDAHEHLALQDVERDIGLAFYLTGLVDSLRGPENIRFVRRIAEATVPLRVAVRLGMIVNEIVTNSLKHAFEPARGGTVEITLEVERGTGIGRLRVMDDGRSLAPTAARGSGLELVEALVEQIGGTLARSNRPRGGLSYLVTFPLGGESDPPARGT
jgi:two-component sensor histidine kinase